MQRLKQDENQSGQELIQLRKEVWEWKSRSSRLVMHNRNREIIKWWDAERTQRDGVGCWFRWTVPCRNARAASQNSFCWTKCRILIQECYQCNNSVLFLVILNVCFFGSKAHFYDNSQVWHFSVHVQCKGMNLMFLSSITISLMS